MMHRIRGIKDLISFKNEECTCFGSVLPGEEKFLIKQKTFKLTPSPINHSNKIPTQQHSFFKKGFKKSLKKHFTPIFHQTATDRSINLNAGSSKIKALDSTGRQSDTREHLSSEDTLKHFNRKTYSHHEELFIQKYTVTAHHIPNIPNGQKMNQASCKTLPSYLPSSPGHILIIPLIQSPRPIKIHYNSPSSEQSIPNKNEDESNSPDSLRSFDRSMSTQNISSKYDEVFIDEINQEEDLRKCESLKILQRPPTMMEITQSSSESQSQEKTSVKEADETRRIKRMDEVAEIFSQIDSQEELEDSDVESIVLGRLNEYSSTMCNEYSEISTIERSTPGRLVRLNSLMTTFDFDRKHLQRTSSQLLSY